MANSTNSIFNYVSLCTGYGGLDLGLEIAVPNAQCIAMAEREAFSCDILLNRMEEGSIEPCPIWSDITTFPARDFRGLVDCLIGGYPCQPFSVAGKKAGVDDPRHLFPHIARIIADMQPEWCFFENVANHLRIGFSEVAGRLHELGYNIAAGLFTAAEVGASHQRERLFILAHSDKSRREARDGFASTRGPQLVDESMRSMEYTDNINHDRGGNARAGWRVEFSNTGNKMGNPDSEGLQRRSERLDQYPGEWVTWPASPSIFAYGPKDRRWNDLLVRHPELRPALSQEEVKSSLRDVANGTASTLAGPRTDILRALGNGVVPGQAAFAFRNLASDLLSY